MSAGPSVARPELAELRARYLAAQLAGGRREALRLVLEEGLGRGVSALDLELEVIQEAQREIGRLWQENTITVAQEHMATAISQIALSHLYERSERATTNGKKVMVACVEGEEHDFPARLVADVLDLAGFEVRYLGANVPTDSLIAAVKREQPDLVALSATMTFNVPALRQAVARLRAEIGEKPPLAVGGGACIWMSGLVDTLKADAAARDAREFVEAARRLLGVRA